MAAADEQAEHPILRDLRPAAASAPAPVITNEIILTWIAQLTDPEVVSLVEGRSGQVEIRLFANKGKVRKVPTILLNAGPQEMV